jgi:DNA damage-binding protein 1
VLTRHFPASLKAEGSIFLFAIIASGKQDLLMRLQANMADAIQTPGGLPFNKYRAFKNKIREADEPYRFVDGELIEKFLDVDDETQKLLVKGLGVEVESVKDLVEELRRLH